MRSFLLLNFLAAHAPQSLCAFVNSDPSIRNSLSHTIRSKDTDPHSKTFWAFLLESQQKDGSVSQLKRGIDGGK